jgi:hypothetical protein
MLGSPHFWLTDKARFLPYAASQLFGQMQTQGLNQVRDA